MPLRHLVRWRIPAWSVVLLARPSGGEAQQNTRGIDWSRDLAHFTQEVPRRHGSPWHAVTREHFEREAAALAGRINSLPSSAAALAIARLAALFGDGHTELQLFDGAHAFRRLPVALYRYADTLRVLAALSPHRELLGARVIRFGKTDVGELLARIEPYLAHDNEAEYLHQAPTTLASPEVLHGLGATAGPDSAELTLELEDGSVVTRVLTGVASLAGYETRAAAGGVQQPWTAVRSDQPYWFEMRPQQGIAYFRLDQSADRNGSPPLATVTREFFREVDALRPEHIVIDVRINSGGNVARNAALLHGIEARTRYRERDALYVITGRATFSAGTDLVHELQRIARPLVVGERSRGDPRVFVNREEFRLPSSGLRVDYSQRWELREKMGERFIPVDLEAPPTFAAYIAGRDVAIEAIQTRIAAGIRRERD